MSRTTSYNTLGRNDVRMHGDNRRCEVSGALDELVNAFLPWSSLAKQATKSRSMLASCFFTKCISFSITRYCYIDLEVKVPDIFRDIKRKRQREQKLLTSDSIG